MAIIAFAAAMVPAFGLLLHPHVAAAAIERNQLTWQLTGTIGGLAATILIQMRLAQDGCFGVCAFPPLAREQRWLVLSVRIVLLVVFLALVIAAALTLLLKLEMLLGLVVSLALMAIWGAAFNALYLAVGYEQAVPRRLRFVLAPDTFWMLARLSGRKYPAERTCVDVLRAPDLRAEDRMLALELIALRPWVSGGVEALHFAAHDVHEPRELSARAREVLSSVGR